MKVFKFLAAAATLITSLVSAQNNPLAIIAPLGGTFQAGTQVAIQWTPNGASTVTLQLRYGSNAGNLATGDPIASSVKNTGYFTWTVPLSLASYSYAIQITGSDGTINYSPPFTVAGGQGALSTASTQSPTSTSTPATSSTTSVSKGLMNTTVATATATATVTGTVQVTVSTGAAAASTSGTRSGGQKMQVADGAFAAVLGLGALVIMT